MKVQEIPSDILKRVRRGVVIPAVPLALDENRKFDELHQRTLTRYYIDAGVGGIAVGVHSTQFAIRDPEINLFEPVLSLVARTIDSHEFGEEILKVAGICGKTDQAVAEATLASGKGYHAGLLSLAALAEENDDGLVEHCRAVAEIIPLIGFYLQPAAGGRLLSFTFWRKFAEIENVLAIKIAPFNRYQTFDVVRAVCEAGREKDIVLYTGNDENIVLDLLTEHKIETTEGTKLVRIVGGLLGHWCVWTRKAVQLLGEIHLITENNQQIPPELLTRAMQVTDSNAAFFDAANSFAGCIPGIHEVLRRQGLLKGTWCLNPNEALSPGQTEEIDRVYKAYPHLHDDDFVKENLEKWLV